MGGMAETALRRFVSRGDMSKPMVSLGAEAKSQNSGRRAFIAKMRFALLGVAAALLTLSVPTKNSI
jgi:peptidoglycan biosynthesis protein MviN/MurJ (putative lipid II flippase)